MWVALVVFALMSMMVIEIVHAVRGESLTWDEGDHIFAGYESWKTHDYGLNPEHPPLVKMVATLPLLGLPLKVPALQGRFFKTEAYMDGREMLFRNGPANGGQYSGETLTLRVRLFTLMFPIAAALLVFFAGKQMFSMTAGFIALTLFCFDPNLLAHSALVTTDMAASCTIFATVFFFWRWIKRPTWQRLVMTGVAAGLALASKHSTVLLAPMLVVLAAGEIAGRWFAMGPQPERAHAIRRASLHILGALVAIVGIGVIVLWAFYGFRYSARPAGLALSPSLAEYVGPLAGIEARGILLAARLHLLPESWLYGLADVRAMANGMPSYFFGKVYLHGVWFYFPALILIKFTLAMLIMAGLTKYAILRGWMKLHWFKSGRELWFIVTPMVIYLLAAMGSHLNIGARHILPVWVFCCVFAGGGMAALMARDKRWAWVAAVLLLFHAGTSLHASPNYMSYANEAWGGPTQTYRYLTDSNTDWAQQLIATSAYLREHNVHDCLIGYFADPFILPADYGISCPELPTADTASIDNPLTVPPTFHGTVLVSAGSINGFEYGSSVLNPYRDFQNLKPVAFIQNGIFVFQGDFNLTLLDAYAHQQRADSLLKAKNVYGSLREAQQAEALAPGEVLPEISLGDALAVSGDKTQAAAAYNRALPKIQTMEPDARAQWTGTVKSKISNL
jgi:hypothetical protein